MGEGDKDEGRAGRGGAGSPVPCGACWPRRGCAGVAAGVMMSWAVLRVAGGGARLGGAAAGGAGQGAGAYCMGR